MSIVNNESEDEFKTNAHPILNSYFMGQVGNVAKSGLWWTTLSPLVVALIRSDTVLSPVRACYNAGVAFAPIGGVLAETVPVRTVLTYTTWARFIVWSICLPLFWFLFVSGAVLDCIPAMYGLLLAIVLLDGIAVAMANVVDIDTGGADLVASNYGLPITDEIRNKFNSLHEIFMNGAIIIFSPAMAFLGILLQHLLNNSKYSDKKDAINSGSIVAIFAGGFFVLSLFSQYFYYSKIPYKALPAELVENGFMKGAITVIKGLGGALKIIWRNGAIKWRLIFLALEIALEDAMIAVVVYEYVAQADWAANGDQVLANVWASIIIAIGKLGGVGSSILIHHHWKPPKEAKGYRPLFWWVFLGSLCVGGIPGSYYLSSTSKWLSAGVLAASVFAFFFASTAPKLGFMTLLQSIAAMVEGSGQVFGYSAVLVTAADALVVFLINMLFRFMNLKWALWIVFGIYVLHGLFELFLGPWLVLQPLQEGDMLKDALIEKEKTPLAVKPMYLDEDPAFMGVGAPINRYASNKTPSRQHIY